MPLVIPQTIIKPILTNSTTRLYLGIVNASQAPVTTQTPTVSIRRDSDGFFFNGTIYVNTSGVPTQLAMTETGTPAPGLYFFDYVDPGLLSPLSIDVYQIRYNSTGTPSGDLYDIRDAERALRDINTQGS